MSIHSTRRLEILRPLQNYDYDGWWLTNLYALRTPKPELLPLKADVKLAKENLDFIKNMLNDKSFNTCVLMLGK